MSIARLSGKGGVFVLNLDNLRLSVDDDEMADWYIDNTGFDVTKIDYLEFEVLTKHEFINWLNTGELQCYPIG